MASTVNSQITDSITEAGLEVIGNAPAISIGNFYQATAQALANAAHNATVAQQQANILGQAVTAQGVALIYSIKI
ncbi:RebB family R body protein [Mucilaginibacter sp. Bleaf8]|uniref:RebB family R body protein n=1 Tax=Mucilaginibacter sp. Bleaf8 TaxID=2834430 RepID=UPI001BCC37EB|nr:RebB family R body protein [Mucilaginibacter sp. Bleaf8]MBS7564766.1 RebB family R body protein [Mucilaginibacter sp. Bleaf8]